MCHSILNGADSGRDSIVSNHSHSLSYRSITALLPLAASLLTQGCDWQAIMTSVSFTTHSLIKHFKLEKISFLTSLPD